jgi:hypothetical protein
VCWLGDSTLHLVITQGGAVRNVTHLGRGPTAAQRIALLWEQPECSRLGCPRPAREIDHRHDYHRTRHTCLDNLDPLCDHDHDRKTYEGWALVAGTGKRPMVPPGHPDHPGNPTYHPRPHPPPNSDRRPPGNSDPPSDGHHSPTSDDCHPLGDRHHAGDSDPLATSGGGPPSDAARNPLDDGASDPTASGDHDPPGEQGRTGDLHPTGDHDRTGDPHEIGHPPGTAGRYPPGDSHLSVASGGDPDPPRQPRASAP